MLSYLIQDLLTSLINFLVKKSALRFKNTYLIFGILHIVFFIGLSVFLYIADSEMKVSDMIFLSAFSLLGIPIILIN